MKGDSLYKPWDAPRVPDCIGQGDMPGDRICIQEEHVRKATIAFDAIRTQIADVLNESGRCVVSVCGGSGVGKSEIASILAFYLKSQGIGTYILSGDNYPRRIPYDNDRERQRVFRTSGLRALVDGGELNGDQQRILREMWEHNQDADPRYCAQYPFLSAYQQAGRGRLARYLGSSEEIDFEELNGIIARFKAGAASLPLKRMGRETTELWYDTVDFSNIDLLMIEWTHSNSEYLQGVDIPILLNSTPEETLAHRRVRKRDKDPDSPFVTMVLELEQKRLDAQAHKARLILAKNGEILSYAAYRALMDGRENSDG